LMPEAGGRIRESISIISRLECKRRRMLTWAN
jgi:hypothetical protein